MTVYRLSAFETYPLSPFLKEGGNCHRLMDFLVFSPFPLGEGPCLPVVSRQAGGRGLRPFRSCYFTALTSMG